MGADAVAAARVGERCWCRAFLRTRSSRRASRLCLASWRVARAAKGWVCKLRVGDTRQECLEYERVARCSEVGGEVGASTPTILT